ncbi:MAG: AEC family transporter, partial [Lachnospiraceae bacterium]|nr:AEC family transporter [Lachnospiraceae bacterium]
MLNSLIYSLNATVPVFAIILIGKFLKNIKLIDLNFANISDKFVYYVCLPCLVFYDLSKTDIRHNFHPKFLLFCFVTTFLSILIIWGLAKIFLKDKTIVGSFVQGSYRSSAAILGTVFILNIYGTTGMAP